MRIVPKDTRQRALAACKTGQYTQEHVAKIYGVCRKTIVNWLKIERTEQRHEPLPRGHKSEAFTDEEKSHLILIVKANPDLTLEQIREKTGKKCSIQTIHNTLKRIGFLLKKHYGPANKSVRISKNHVVNGKNGRRKLQ
jgi:transposase